MSTDLYWVRSRIGDTATNAQLLTDEIISNQLSVATSKYTAAAQICRGPLRAALIRTIDRSGTGFSATRSQINQHVADLAAQLEVEGLSQITPSVGGVSDSAKDSLESDTDFLQPTFKSGQHLNDS